MISPPVTLKNRWLLAGDALGAYLERPLSALGFGLLPLTLAVTACSVIWLLICRFLGRTQHALAATNPHPPG